MKRLKKGFTLIELLVVIAIIGILATTLAPKLREQLAKAKDSKAVALLGAARTAGSTLVVDKMVQSTGSSITAITDDELMARLDKKSNELFTKSGSKVLVGGTRSSATSKVDYTGTGVILATSGTAIGTSGISISDDEISIELKGDTNKTYSTEGKLWTSY